MGQEPEFAVKEVDETTAFQPEGQSTVDSQPGDKRKEAKKKYKKNKKKLEETTNPLTGEVITADGLSFNFNFDPQPFKDIIKPDKEVSANDTVVQSFGIVIGQYFGAFVLDELDIAEVVDFSNSQKHSDWWNIGYSLHSGLQGANYKKSGMCPSTMEG
jgi:hypothetical protein